MLKVVLDTNIFVSGLISKQGAPAQVLAAWRDRRFLLCCSPAIMAEIRRVLTYPRLRHKYGISDVDVEDLLDLLRQEPLMLPGKSSIEITIPDDPSDEMFLSCAGEAAADFIVSGDRHLLSLGEYAGIPIVTVPVLLEALAQEEKQERFA